MRIFVSHSRNYNYVDNLYDPLQNSQLSLKHEILLPHKNDNNISTKDIIKNSDLLIAETSFSSTGQGIELGWANLFKVPVICIYKEGVSPPKSLKFITKRFISYKSEEDMTKKLSAFLSKNC